MGVRGRAPSRADLAGEALVSEPPEESALWGSVAVGCDPVRERVDMHALHSWCSGSVSAPHRQVRAWCAVTLG